MECVGFQDPAVPPLNSTERSLSLDWSGKLYDEGEVSTNPTQKLPVASKIVLKPAVCREDLLRHAEHDPEGAEDFLELLREFREEPTSRSEPEKSATVVKIHRKP